LIEIIIMEFDFSEIKLDRIIEMAWEEITSSI